MKSRTSSMKNILFLIARFFTGFIFLAAGFSKLVEPVQNFQHMLSSYAVFPESLISPIAYILPWLEFILGAYLILGYLPRFSAAVLGCFSLTFMAVLLLSGAFFGRGGESCGCFGEGAWIKLSVKQIFFIDLANFFICISLALKAKCFFSLDSFLKKI
jgi:uncharacterized membrane protein YphA (DoxX/SURF4 family)